VKKYLKERVKSNLTIPVTDIKSEKDIPSIAKKHKVPESDIRDQLKKGKKVEREHTGNDKAATDIALDHIDELPDYYDDLVKMEKKAKKKLKEGFGKEDTKEKINKNILKKYGRKTATGKKANDIDTEPEIEITQTGGYYR
jgi:hypothetical protein